MTICLFNVHCSSAYCITVFLIIRSLLLRKQGNHLCSLRTNARELREIMRGFIHEIINSTNAFSWQNGFTGPRKSEYGLRGKRKITGIVEVLIVKSLMKHS